MEREIERKREREMRDKRKREKAYESIISGELERVRGKLATSQLLRIREEEGEGACPIFTGSSKSNLPARSSIGRQWCSCARFPSLSFNETRESKQFAIAILIYYIIYLFLFL